MTRNFRISFRNVTQDSTGQNRKMFFAQTVDHDVIANTPFDAVKQVFPHAHYYYMLNPHCWTFYDNQFGNVFVKEFDAGMSFPAKIPMKG